MYDNYDNFLVSAETLADAVAATITSTADTSVIDKNGDLALLGNGDPMEIAKAYYAVNKNAVSINHGIPESKDDLPYGFTLDLVEEAEANPVDRNRKALASLHYQCQEDISEEHKQAMDVMGKVLTSYDRKGPSFFNEMS